MQRVKRAIVLVLALMALCHHCSRANVIKGPYVFHDHTVTYSDGKYTMAYYAKLARSMGLKGIHMTDHSDYFIRKGNYLASVAEAKNLSGPDMQMFADSEITYQWIQRVGFLNERWEGHMGMSSTTPADLAALFTALHPFANYYGDNPNLFGGPDVLGSVLSICTKRGTIPVLYHPDTIIPSLDGVFRYHYASPSTLLAYGYRGGVGIEFGNNEGPFSSPQGVLNIADYFERSGYRVALYSGSDDHGQGSADLLRWKKYYFWRNNRWTWIVGTKQSPMATVVTYGSFALTECSPTPNESSTDTAIVAQLTGKTSWNAPITWHVYGDLARKHEIAWGNLPASGRLVWPIPRSLLSRQDTTLFLTINAHAPEVNNEDLPIAVFSPFRIHLP